jgi:hypothetical protein
MGIVNHIFQKNGQVLQLMISLKIKTLALLSSPVEFTSGDRAFFVGSSYDGLQPRQVSVAGTRSRIEFSL